MRTCKIFLKTVSAAVFFIAQVVPAAAEADAIPQKITLKLCSVETADTRMDKAWAPPTPPSVEQELPYTDSDLVMLTGPALQKALEENRLVRAENRRRSARLQLASYIAAEQHMNEIINRYQATTAGRFVILALDTFAGYMGEYCDPEFIQFFHRMDNDEGAKEAFLQAVGSEETAAVPYLVKLVFATPREQSGAVSVTSTYRVSKSTVTQMLTVQIQALDGRMIFAKNIKETASEGYNSVVQTTDGGGDLIQSAMEKCLESAAKAINDHFVKQTTFTVEAKNDKNGDFRAENAVLTVDGVERPLNSPISLLAGKHEVKVTHSGFRQTDPEVMNISSSGVRKIIMDKALCSFSVELQCPQDAGSDSLADADVSITGDNGMQIPVPYGKTAVVPAGNYTLNVSLKGFEPVSKKIVLSSSAHAEPVVLKKSE